MTLGGRTGASVSHRRWLLLAATATVPVAVLVSLPMAFGIVMSGDDFPDANNPFLYGLIAVVVAAVGGLISAWICSRAAVDHLSGRFSALALAAAGLILLAFAAEMLSVVLGY